MRDERLHDHGLAWEPDNAASGLRWRAFLECGDELIAYEDGEWEIRLVASNGQTMASHRESTATNARARAARVYEAITGRRPTVR